MAQIFDKEYFYYNKQAIQLTNLDYQNQTVESLLKGSEKSIKLVPIRIEQDDIVVDELEITAYVRNIFESFKLSWVVYQKI